MDKVKRFNQQYGEQKIKNAKTFLRICSKHEVYVSASSKNFKFFEDRSETK